MKHITAALAVFTLLVPSLASADPLSACKARFPHVKLTPVTSAIPMGKDYMLTANGTRFKAVFDEDNFASFINAINGGKITLYADKNKNLYGPLIAGNGSQMSEAERACIKF